MIHTREQFIKWWDTWVPENPALKRNHPLFIPETQIKPGPPSEWFIQAQSSKTNSLVYWAWCNANLKGMVRCYMLNESEDWEWWGFTRKDDLVLWLLKWT